MRGHGRPNRRGVGFLTPLLLAAALFFFVAPGVAQEPPLIADSPSEPLPGNPIVAFQRADARLNDVTFVDPQQGWAVGDAGVIWHTTDGGQHWEQQSSGVDCRLESV